MTLKFNTVLEVVELGYIFVQNFIKLSTAVHQLSCPQTFSPYPATVKKSKNPVLWPWPFTYDLEIPWLLSGCQDECLWKISSSWVQLFISYHANSEKTPMKTIQRVISLDSRPGDRLLASSLVCTARRWVSWPPPCTCPDLCNRHKIRSISYISGQSLGSTIIVTVVYNIENDRVARMTVWLNGLVVSALEIRAQGPRFDSRVTPLLHWVATLGKLFTHIASPVSQLQETGVQKGVFSA